MEKDKIQASEKKSELHVEILNLKILNETLQNENATRNIGIKDLEQNLTSDKEEELNQALKELDLDYKILLANKDIELANLKEQFNLEANEKEYLAPEVKSYILESQRLAKENSKLLAQVIDQENVLNNKINVLVQEKQNLDAIIKQFTKSNTLLENMVYNSKVSYNTEGLRYDANKPPKRESHTPTSTQNTPLKSPIKRCSYCIKMVIKVYIARLKKL
ncbi:hypothetical protein POM88_010436 [Heracleum sosnowskyi]|uniref:Uncharacterized protein n=1 Tax=Heracleum sosnowskyi TaxID=360622 RepID=A0AAD8MVR9_9APIA|nr:hypothetical protein POM88_010436 [Heracleum sosnowskyi]